MLLRESMSGKPAPPRPLCAVMPAVLCSFADYYGLSAIVPLIPFHLEVDGGMSDASAAEWAGAINSVQYVGVIIGCVGWGVASDRLGALQASVLRAPILCPPSAHPLPSERPPSALRALAAYHCRPTTCP